MSQHWWHWCNLCNIFISPHTYQAGYVTDYLLYMSSCYVCCWIDHQHWSFYRFQFLSYSHSTLLIHCELFLYTSYSKNWCFDHHTGQYNPGVAIAIPENRELVWRSPHQFLRNGSKNFFCAARDFFFYFCYFFATPVSNCFRRHCALAPNRVRKWKSINRSSYWDVWTGAARLALLRLAIRANRTSRKVLKMST